MKTTKISIFILLSICIISCHDKPPVYQNRIAQDLTFRLGKWYSITDSAKYNWSTNSLLDTIWFINDTLAGWTGFSSNPHEYIFRKTYFDKTNYNIVYLATGNPDTTRIDTIVTACGMNKTQDTFGIYWPNGFYGVQLQQYVKMRN